MSLAAQMQPADNNPPLAPANLNAAELLTALIAAQQENGKLRAQVTSLQREIAELKLAAARPHRGPISKDAATAASIKLSTAIARIAKFGQLFYTPCITEEAFGIVRPDFEHDHPDRYLDENLSLSYAADLYHLFPVQYHESIEQSGTVKSLFLKAMSKGISNSIERFRRQAGEIFGTAQDIFRKPNYPRASVPRLRHLLGISTAIDGRDVYATFPPILFPDGYDGNMSHVFLNPILFQIARVIIYGDSYLSWTPDSGHKKLNLRSGGTYRHEDGREVMATSGLISMMAILARYMLSADTEFGAKGVGNVTKNDWHANHTFYRRLLIEGLHIGTKSIVRIVNKWNENVFPIAKERTGEVVPDSEEEREATRQRSREDHGGRGGIQGLLARMSLDDVNSSDSGDSTADAASDRDAAEHASVNANPPASTRTNSVADDLDSDDPIDLPNPVPFNNEGHTLAAEPTVTLSTARLSSARRRTLHATSANPPVSNRADSRTADNLNPTTGLPDSVPNRAQPLAAQPTEILSNTRLASSARRTISSRPAVSARPAVPPDVHAQAEPESASAAAIVPIPVPADPPQVVIAPPPRRAATKRNKAAAATPTAETDNGAPEAGPARSKAAAAPVRAGRKKAPVPK